MLWPDSTHCWDIFTGIDPPLFGILNSSPFIGVVVCRFSRFDAFLSCYCVFLGHGCEPDPGQWQEASAHRRRLWPEGGDGVPHFDRS